MRGFDVARHARKRLGEVEGSRPTEGPRGTSAAAGQACTLPRGGADRRRVDLDALPVLKCWPLDGGRYITLPLVFTRHPLTGPAERGHVSAAGLRQADDRDALAPAQGRSRALSSGSGGCEVAVAIGTDPAVTYAATAPLPGMMDEMLFAGFLRGDAVDLVQCRTVDLQVPAHTRVRARGLRGSGRASRGGAIRGSHRLLFAGRLYPVFHLTAITHRRDPIYSTTIVGQAPMEDAFSGRRRSGCFLPLMRMTLPELVDMDLPKEGGFHNCALVSMRKRYPLHARKVMHALLGCGTDAVLQVHRGRGRGRGRPRLCPGGLAGVQQRRLEA